MIIKDTYLLLCVSVCQALLYTNEHILHLSFKTTILNFLKI